MRNTSFWMIAFGLEMERASMYKNGIRQRAKVRTITR
jgi:hypothetical protein